MRICPNFSDPIIEQQYNAIAEDSELGPLEAMREFMEAQKQDRAIMTPEQVKEKLKARYTPKTPEEIANTESAQSAFIAETIADPTMTDPDTQTGIYYLNNPVVNTNIDPASTDNTKAIEAVRKLSTQLNADYQIVTPQEAIEATATSRNPIKNLAEAIKKKAFFYKGKVYFIEGSLTTDMAVHEFSHVLVRSLFNSNPELFNKLFNDALAADSNLLNEALDEYADLKDAIANEQDETVKEELKTKYLSLVMEEVIVKALTKASLLEQNNQPLEKGFANYIKNLMYQIKQLLRKAFGSKIDVSKLKPSTTLNELADMLMKGGNFEINTESILESDVVAYNQYRQDFINNLSKIPAEDIVILSTGAFDIAKKQVKLFIENKNYKALAELLTDEFKRGDLQEIMNNLSKYAGDINEKAEKLMEDIDRSKNNLEALVNMMFRLEKVMDHVLENLKSLSKDTTEGQEAKDNLQKAYYYKSVVDYWKEYSAQALTIMEKAGVNKSSDVYSLMLKINNTADSANNKILELYETGSQEYLWDELSDLAESIDQEFNDVIATLKKKGASQNSRDRRYKEYHNLTEAEYNRLQELKNAKNAGMRLNADELNELKVLSSENQKGLQLNKEKISLMLKGQVKDANFLNNFLQGYMYSTDPIIASFTAYLKKNMGAVQVTAQNRSYEFMTAIQPLIKEAGIKFTNPGELGKLIGFVDEVGGYEKGVFVKKKRWALLNKFKNYRYVIDEFDDKIKKLKAAYYQTKDTKIKEDLSAVIEEKRKHLKEWFQQEFIDEVYEKDKIFNKEPGDIIGQEALRKREEFFEELRLITEPLTTETDIFNANERMAQLWRKYRIMHSMYDVEGNLKTDSFVDADGNTVITNELSIAKRLQEYKEASREFYEFKPRKGVFENTLKKFEQELETKLLNEGYELGSSFYDEEFNKKRNAWLKKNMVIKIKDEFYKKRAEILERIKNILAIAKLSDKQRKDLDFENYWVTILDATAGFRDDNGQPMGNEIGEKRRAEIKTAQEAIEKAKEKWAGYSGLTRSQMESLQELFKINKERDLTDDEQDRFFALLRLKDKLGLTDSQRTDLNKAYAELAEIQTKSPTPYYLEAVNNWFNKFDIEKIYKEKGIREVTEENLDVVFSNRYLKDFFKQSPEFKEWFEKNHIQKTYYDKELDETVTVNERLYVWSVIKPTDPEMYEKTEIKDVEGNIIETLDGVPSLKYFARVIKKEYRTGYNKETDKVELKVGEHIDNQGNFLPKDLPNSPYRNKEYYNLKNSNPALFKLLEKITEFHLDWQKGSPKTSKLYMDFPRYQMSDAELLQSKRQKKQGEELSLFQRILNRIRQFFYGSRADYDNGLNFKAQLTLVQTDMFDNQINKIPISGLSDLDVDDTSTDIITGMMRYMFGAEKQKKLIEINPYAQALRAILGNQKNKIKDEDAINSGNYTNRNIISYANKKGKYVRKEEFEALYEREFLGINNVGWGADVPAVQNISNWIFKQSAGAFFNLNIPSALKNSFGAKYQALIESAAGKYLTTGSYLKGEAWSANVMKKISFSIYKGPTTDVDILLAETMDFAQGRTEEKLGTRMTRTLAKDIIDRSWLVSIRKWTELQSTFASSAGMMYKEMVKMGSTEIPYIEAFEIKNGKLVLKPGIDPEYGIIYNEDGSVNRLGKKFNAMKNKIHMVNNKLIGAVSKFDQPGAKRYLAWRFITFMKGYFTEMFMNRFGTKRINIGLGTTDEGTYITAFKSLMETIRERNLAHMSPEDRRAFIKIAADIMGLFILGMLSTMVLGGFDPDDPDRYEKLREKSGPLPLLGISPDEDPFKLAGFLQVHAGLLMMQIKAENEQFAFWKPKQVLEPMLDLKSIGFGPTLNAYMNIGSDIVNMIEGSDKAYYTKRVGPYIWQQEGGAKIWSHAAKMWGINASSVSPADALKNFQTFQALNLNR